MTVAQEIPRDPTSPHYKVENPRALRYMHARTYISFSPLYLSQY